MESGFQGVPKRRRPPFIRGARSTEPVDAWARLRRTRTFIETRTFGTTAEAERAGRRVRKIHDPLTGTDPDGTRYQVDEPDLLLWVHCGEVASCVDIARRSRQRVFRGALRAIHRTETAGD